MDELVNRIRGVLGRDDEKTEEELRPTLTLCHLYRHDDELWLACTWWVAALNVAHDVGEWSLYPERKPNGYEAMRDSDARDVTVGDAHRIAESLSTALRQMEGIDYVVTDSPWRAIGFSEHQNLENVQHIRDKTIRSLRAVLRFLKRGGFSVEQEVINFGDTMYEPNTDHPKEVRSSDVDSEHQS